MKKDVYKIDVSLENKRFRRIQKKALELHSVAKARIDVDKIDDTTISFLSRTKDEVAKIIEELDTLISIETL